MEKFKSWLLSNEAKKDKINSMIGKYACHKEGDDVIFVNVDDPKDSFSRPLTTGQYKLLRQRFNNSYRRGGQVTNRYKIDPALITRDRINYNIDTILGLRTSDTSDLGLSLNKKYEHDVANNLDDVLGD